MKRNLSGEVRRILLEHWDPIGVRDVGITDEYDQYVPTVEALIATGRSKEEIVDKLSELEERIGVSQTQDHRTYVADLLLKLR